MQYFLPLHRYISSLRIEKTLDSLKLYFTGLVPGAAGTVLLAFFATLIGYAATKLIERGKIGEAKRFWRLTVRHVATAIFVLGLLVIWRKELQTLLLVLGAAAAGFMVAFKEAWLSLLSFWMRLTKRPYGLDDFIEIDHQCGRVTDITWMTTILAETTSTSEGLSYTGRVLHIPNNRMLLATLIVENFASDFNPHTMKLPLPHGANILKAESLLIAAAEKHCQPFYVEADKALSARSSESAIDLPSVQPRVRIQIADHGEATLLLRIVVPFKERARVEQQVLHEFLKGTNSDTWPRKAHK